MAFTQTVNGALKQAADEAEMPLSFLRAICLIESSGNPKCATGQYKGLFQLSADEFRKHGGKGSIFDPHENARAAARKLKAERAQFVKRVGREATDAEAYLAHQQGLGGISAHLKDRARAAWQSMHATIEGKQKGPAWSKRAIWQNLPAEAKKKFGTVEKVSSGDFIDWWVQRYRRALEQTKQV
jgi:hypothetical protein